MKIKLENYRHYHAMAEFLLVVDINPVVTIEKLARLERTGHRHAEKLCNVADYLTIYDREISKIEHKARQCFLWWVRDSLIFNRDPRGCFLKIEPRPENKHRFPKYLITDVGGDIIVIPD